MSTYLAWVVASWQSWPSEASRGRTKTTSSWSLHRSFWLLRALRGCEGLWFLYRCRVIGIISYVVIVIPVVCPLLEVAAEVSVCAWRVIAIQEPVVKVRITTPASTNTRTRPWPRRAGEAWFSRHGHRWRRRWCCVTLILCLTQVVTHLIVLFIMRQLPCLIHWLRWIRWIRWTHIPRCTGMNRSMSWLFLTREDTRRCKSPVNF